MLIGYARVSTSEQDTAMQLAALRKAGVRKVSAEQRSAVKHRPQLLALLDTLRDGDVLVVTNLIAWPGPCATSWPSSIALTRPARAFGRSLRRSTQRRPPARWCCTCSARWRNSSAA